VSACVTLENISLDIPIWLQPESESRGWSAMLLRAAFAPPQRNIRRLLSGISFQVHEGERVGLLGINGAGKSTLLRIINGVYMPTTGAIRVNGTRQALLNMSLGFNNEATVTENIFLRGTAMGMKTSMIRELVKPILVFSGLEEKMSHRLNTLSAGQRLRLGFSISTAIQHDILLMDEWIGTGDAQFMTKAKERLLNRMEGSKIVFLASHSLGLLKDVCNRGMVLDQGYLLFDGDMQTSIEAYQQIVARAGIARNHAGERIKTIGALDSVKFENGLLHFKGWALQEFSTMPPLLVLEVSGEQHIIRNFNRHVRNDVQRKFGLPDPLCGFEAALELPHDMNRIESLALYGGTSAETIDGPFRISSDVMRQMQKGIVLP